MLLLLDFIELGPPIPVRSLKCFGSSSPVFGDACFGPLPSAIPPPYDSISGQIPNWIYPYPNQFGMRRTMADPCICHSATCPHLQHVHICNIGTSAASPEEPHFAKIVFPVKYQVILRTETGKMISVARRTHPKRSQTKFIG